MTRPLVGIAGPATLTEPRHNRDSLLSAIENSSIDHLVVGDHVSFHDGFGFDGLINATTLAALTDDVKIFVGVYLLALRHPVTVARQLSSLSAAAPGRLILGVGLGGEDRHELEICGVDPRTRGRRTNDSLAALRGLMTGKPFSYDCDFFQFEDAVITPKPEPVIPLVIGGRSDAAVRRAGKYGDGWLGLWCSPERFKSVLTEIDSIASAEDRQIANWEHGLNVWAGFDQNEATAKQHVAAEMQRLYKVPFEKFEKYTPYGTPEKVAEFLAPYVENGCKYINIGACAGSDQHAVEAVSQVSELLQRM